MCTDHRARCRRRGCFSRLARRAVALAAAATCLAQGARGEPLPARANETIPWTVLEPHATAAVEAWLRTPDPVLVILVLDGLRADAIEAVAPDTSPLMPHVQSVAATSLEFADCVTGATEPELGLWHLLTGQNAVEGLHRLQLAGAVVAPPGRRHEELPGLPWLAARGFELHGLGFRADLARDALLVREFPWLQWPSPAQLPPLPGLERARTEIAAMQTSLADALARHRPTVLVWIPDLLLPPFALPDRWLAACDPTPWRGGQRVVSAEELRRNRLLRAHRVAEVGSAALLERGAAKDSNEPLWISNTAHALADSLLGGLLADLTAPAMRDRVGLIVAATHGTSLRGPDALGGPLDPDRTRVPLLWRVPGIPDVHDRVLAPVLVGDVVTTLVRRIDPQAPLPAGAVDWAEPVLPDRERWSFAWNSAGRKTRPVAAVRLTTSELVYREEKGRGMLFDVRADPAETENLAPDQQELARRLREKVRAALCGSRPEIWLVAKAPGPDRRIEGTLSVTGTSGDVEPIDLEPDDVLTHDAAIRFQFGGAPDLDGLRVRVDGDPSLRLALRATPGPAWPVTAGSQTLGGRAGTWSLTFPDAAFVGAVTRNPPTDLATWAAGLEPGIHLVIVSSDDASLLSP